MTNLPPVRKEPANLATTSSGSATKLNTQRHQAKSWCNGSSVSLDKSCCKKSTLSRPKWLHRTRPNSTNFADNSKAVTLPIGPTICAKSTVAMPGPAPTSRIRCPVDTWAFSQALLAQGRQTRCCKASLSISSSVVPNTYSSLMCARLSHGQRDRSLFGQTGQRWDTGRRPTICEAFLATTRFGMEPR